MEEGREGVAGRVGSGGVLTVVCHAQVEEPVIIVHTLLAVLDGRTSVLGQFEHGGVVGAAVRKLNLVRTVSCPPSLAERFHCVLQT